MTAFSEAGAGPRGKDSLGVDLLLLERAKINTDRILDAIEAGNPAMVAKELLALKRDLAKIKKPPQQVEIVQGLCRVIDSSILFVRQQPKDIQWKRVKKLLRDNHIIK